MPSSSNNRILRGLDIKGWKTYEARVAEEMFQEVAQQDSQEEEASLPQPTREEMERQIEEERKAVLDKAQREAEKIRQEARQQAEKEAEEIKEKARKEGFEKAQKKGEAEAKKLKKEAEKVLSEAKARREELLAGVEPEIMQISINLAEKLLHSQVELNPEIILSVASRSLESLPSGQEVVLKINPEDEQVCREHLDRLRGLVRTGASLEVEADADIPGGSCLVESEEAEVELYLFRELGILGRRLMEIATQKQDNH